MLEYFVKDMRFIYTLFLMLVLQHHNDKVSAKTLIEGFGSCYINEKQCMGGADYINESIESCMKNHNNATSWRQYYSGICFDTITHNEVGERSTYIEGSDPESGRCYTQEDCQGEGHVHEATTINICKSMNYPSWKQMSTGICYNINRPAAQAIGFAPHFMTWKGGYQYNYNGQCDLVFVHNPMFNGNQGMSIHIRTKIQDTRSYITAIAIRLGNVTLETTSSGRILINGVENTVLPNRISNYRIKRTEEYIPEVDILKYQLSIHLNDVESITIHGITGNNNIEYMGLYIDISSNETFGNSSGMIGGYFNHHEIGWLISRDGTKNIPNVNEFAQHWQVNPDIDGSLFSSINEPQYPNECIVSTQQENNNGVVSLRNLRAFQNNMIGEAEARDICSCDNVPEEVLHWCVSDVLATDKMSMKMLYTHLDK